jgi:hypothetical protein
VPLYETEGIQLLSRVQGPGSVLVLEQIFYEVNLAGGDMMQSWVYGAFGELGYEFTRGWG